MYATDRQMLDKHHRLMSPALGAGRNKQNSNFTELLFWHGQYTDSHTFIQNAWNIIQQFCYCQELPAPSGTVEFISVR